MMAIEEELDRLLETESPEDADRRAAAALDTAMEVSGRKLVIYGAGNLGRRALDAARTLGLPVVAFADANPSLWGKSIEGISVLSPHDAASRFSREALFLICVWHPATTGGIVEIMERLRALGCKTAPFVSLFWKVGGRFLPYYCWDRPGALVAQSKEVTEACRLFRDDPESQRNYVRQIRLRLLADFSAPGELAAEPQYFPSDIFRPRPNETFVDCGAYDGDSITAFLDWSGGRFRRVIALEADPQNFAKLEPVASAHADRIQTVRAAVADRTGTLAFRACGQGSASVASDGEHEVACITLDEALEGQPVTFIKMDIEGSEEAALRGGVSAIQRDRPILAICVYHRIHDLWMLPLLAATMVPEYKLALRSYCLDGLDTVCYAVPPDRWQLSGGRKE
jgi:FkbM family methyltransferase